MKYVINFILVSAVLFSIGLLQACFSDSNANDPVADVTQEDFDALVSRVESLEDLVETLSDNVHIVVPRDGNSNSKTTGSSKLQLADLDAVGCTLSGRNPHNQLVSDEFQCQSPEGVLFNVPIMGGPPSELPFVFYETSDCTGDGLLATDHLSESALLDGVVASYGSATGSRIGYMQSDGSNHVQRTVGSAWSKSDGCEQYTNYDPGPLILIVPNVPEDTGVENIYPALVTQ